MIVIIQALLVELLELKAHHAKAAESRTLMGHLRNALGYAMSGYCVYRVLASFKALLVGEDFSSDPVSRWVISFCHSPSTVRQMALCE